MSVFRKKENVDASRFVNDRASAEFLMHENLTQSNFNDIYMKCGVHQQLDCRNCVLLDDGWRPQRELLVHHSYWGYILPSDYVAPNIFVAPVPGAPIAYIVQPTDAYGSISLTLFTAPFTLPTTPPSYYYYIVIGDPGFTTTTNTTFCVGQSFALAGLINNNVYSNINSANTWYIANSTAIGVYNFSPINLSEFCSGDLLKIAEPPNLFRIEMMNLVLGTWELVVTNLVTYNRYQIMVIRGCPPNCQNEHHYINNGMRRRNGIIAGGYDRAQFLIESLDKNEFDNDKDKPQVRQQKGQFVAEKTNPFSIVDPFTMLNVVSKI